MESEPRPPEEPHPDEQRPPEEPPEEPHPGEQRPPEEPHPDEPREGGEPIPTPGDPLPSEETAETPDNDLVDRAQDLMHK
jgi:hypothetical protein